MLVLSNTIRRVFTKRYNIVPESLASENYTVQLDVELNKNKNLENIAKYFEVNFYSQKSLNDINVSSFKQVFPNRYLSNSGNLKRYQANKEFNQSFKNDIRKNIFIDYHTKLSNENEVIKDLIPFNEQNFIEGSNVYRITFSNIISNIIKIRSEQEIPFNNVRVFILDERKNIIAKTDFLSIDLSISNITKKRAAFIEQSGENLPAYLSSLHLNNLIQQLNKDFFTLSRLGDHITLNNPNKLSYDFEIKQIILKYFTSQDRDSVERVTYRSYLLNPFNLNSSSFDFYNNSTRSNKENLDEIQNKICKNMIIGHNIFRFEIDFYPMESSLPKFTKEIVFSNLDPFIIYCFNNKKDVISSKIQDAFSNRDVIITPSEENIGLLNLRFKNIQLEREILEKINISKIYKNEEFYEIKHLYNTENFNLSSKVDYKSLNYLNISNKSLNTRLSFNDKNIAFIFTLKNNLIDFTRNWTIEKDITHKSLNQNQDFLILNSFLKQNLNYENINFNRTLDSNNSAIFSYDRFILRNLDNLRNLAYNLGYSAADNVSGDVEKFLKNCVFHIENETIINAKSTKRSTFKNVYAFGAELFNFDNFQNNFITFEETYLNKIKTEDSTLFVFFENIRVFFNTNTEDLLDAYTKLSFISNDMSIENKITIKSLCFPEIMTKFKYPNTNIIGDVIKINESVIFTPEEEQALNNVTTSFLSSKTRNVINIKNYKNILFKDNVRRVRQDNLSASDFASFFSLLNQNTVSENNSNSLYSKTYNINKQQILDLININKSFPTVILDAEERSFNNVFCDLSIDDSGYINYIDFPINYSFLQTSYNPEIDGYNFRMINFLNDITKDIKLDIQKLSPFISSINSISNFKTSTHFLFSDQKNNVSKSFKDKLEQDQLLSLYLKLVSYKGKEYITYSNNFLQDANTESSLNFPSLRSGHDTSHEYTEDVGTLEFFNINQDRLFNDFVSNSYFSNFINLLILQNSLNYLHKVIIRSTLTMNIKLKNDVEKSVDLFFNNEILPINLVNQYRVFNNNISIINVNSI